MTAISSSLMDLPTDVLYNGIAPRLSVTICGALRQTCHLMNQFPDSSLLNLLKKHIPEFEKKDPKQSDLQAYKDKWVVLSNMRYGVCTIHHADPGDVKLPANLPWTLCPESAIRVRFRNPDTYFLTESIPVSTSLIEKWAVDAHHIAMSFYTNDILIWDRQTGAYTIRELFPHRSSALELHGNFLFILDAACNVKIWDLETKGIATIRIEKYYTYFLPQLHCDGKRLYIPRNGEVKVLNFNASQYEVLQELAPLLNQAEKIAQQALLRFLHMPPKMVEAIQYEATRLYNKERSKWGDYPYYKLLSSAISSYQAK